MPLHGGSPDDASVGTRRFSVGVIDCIGCSQRRHQALPPPPSLNYWWPARRRWEFLRLTGKSHVSCASLKGLVSFFFLLCTLRNSKIQPVVGREKNDIMTHQAWILILRFSSPNLQILSSSVAWVLFVASLLKFIQTGGRETWEVLALFSLATANFLFKALLSHDRKVKKKWKSWHQSYRA